MRPIASSSRALTRAWSLLGTDPVRLGFAAALCLILDLGTTAALWNTWRTDGLSWSQVATILFFRQALLAVPTAALWAWGEEARSGKAAPWLRRAPAVFAVSGLTTCFVVPTAALAASPALLLMTALMAQGAAAASVFVGLGALLAGVMASWWLRARVAWAVSHVVLDGYGAPRAWRTAWGAPRGDRQVAFRVIAFSDLARGLGAALLLAGALPAYTLAPLALLAHRRT